MIKTIGRVIKVFIPEQYKNGNLLDVMDRTNIGFKVVTNNSMRDIIVEQNELNAKIMKNDLVTIIEQTISGKDFIDIELYEGDENDNIITLKEVKKAKEDKGYTDYQIKESLGLNQKQYREIIKGKEIKLKKISPKDKVKADLLKIDIENLSKFCANTKFLSGSFFLQYITMCIVATTAAMIKLCHNAPQNGVLVV